MVQECKERNATIIYATHIFDGLGDFATHLVHVRGGAIIRCVDQVNSLLEAESNSKGSGLLAVVLRWLTEDFQIRKESRAAQAKDGKVELKTKWEQLSDNMKEHGDKYYDYSH